MAPEPSDPLLGAVILILAIASVGTWFALADRLTHGPILAYEPRRPVPWHGVWTLLPLLMVAGTLFMAICSQSSAADADSATPGDLVERLAWGSLQQTALVVAFLAIMIAVSRPTLADLGLPKNSRELARDVKIGVIAWLAALAPVYGVQLILIKLFGNAEGHPLIKMIEEHTDPTLFFLAFFAAVVVAPLCEEPLFRLVLQGWLEKWEDYRLGWRMSPALVVQPVAEEMVAAETVIAESNDSAPIPSEVAVPVPAEPPEIGVGGLPYGWLPIGVSALLFALAHVGYGPDPIPLFLLALILGYVYQRTHRIVPSIVTHALFNGMSLFMLWRAMSAGAHQ
jgi:membrane protease YdiL (CAAX protease family)